MSDTPPDQKEAGDKPAGPRSAWVSCFMILLLLPVLYVLSIGPVYWLVDMDYISSNVYVIYRPLHYLPDTITYPIDYYLNWLTPSPPVHYLTRPR
jgi:hypothetical protein